MPHHELSLHLDFQFTTGMSAHLFCAILSPILPVTSRLLLRNLTQLRRLSMSPAFGSKRKPADGSISPPPLRRKIVSGTTSMPLPRPPRLIVALTCSLAESAVANFFTPTSQKPKSRTIWTERAPNEDVPETLLVARYEPEKAEDPRGPKRRKIAAFDLVGRHYCTSMVPFRQRGNPSRTRPSSRQHQANSMPARPPTGSGGTTRYRHA
jgi:hypothetical protein